VFDAFSALVFAAQVCPVRAQAALDFAFAPIPPQTIATAMLFRPISATALPITP